MAGVRIGSGTNSSVITPAEIANMAIMGLQTHLFFPLLGRSDYDDAFAKHIGQILTVKKAYKAFTTAGRTIASNAGDNDINRLIDEYVEIKVNIERKAVLDLGNEEKTFDVYGFYDRYMPELGRQLASDYDTAGGVELHEGVHFLARNDVGGNLTTANMTDINAFCARRHMPDGMNFIMSPEDIAGLSKEILQLNPQADSIMSEIIRQRYRGHYGGYAIYSSVNVPDYEVADYRSTATTASAPQLSAAATDGATTLATDGWGSSPAARKILNKGQLITIAGVKDVEPYGNRKTLNEDKTFLVTADVECTATGTANIPIYPEINAGGATATAGGTGNTVVKKAFKNCSAVPGDNAAITVVGEGTSDAGAGTTYRQIFGFHPSALQYVNIRMSPSTKGGVEQGYARDPQTGLAMLYTAWTNGNDLEERHRLDISGAVKVTRPEVAVRVVTGG